MSYLTREELDVAVLELQKRMDERECVTELKNYTQDPSPNLQSPGIIEVSIVLHTPAGKIQVSQIISKSQYVNEDGAKLWASVVTREMIEDTFQKSQELGIGLETESTQTGKKLEGRL